MLNFYDTEAVKAFVLKILVENRELKDSLDLERTSSTSWFKQSREAEAKVKDLEAKVAELAAEIASLKGVTENE